MSGGPASATDRELQRTLLEAVASTPRSRSYQVRQRRPTRSTAWAPRTRFLWSPAREGVRGSDAAVGPRGLVANPPLALIRGTGGHGDRDCSQGVALVGRGAATFRSFQQGRTTKSRVVAIGRCAAGPRLDDWAQGLYALPSATMLRGSYAGHQGRSRTMGHPGWLTSSRPTAGSVFVTPGRRGQSRWIESGNRRQPGGDQRQTGWRKKSHRPAD